MRTLNKVQCKSCGHIDFDANVEKYDIEETSPHSFKTAVNMLCPKCGAVNGFEYIPKPEKTK